MFISNTFILQGRFWHFFNQHPTSRQTLHIPNIPQSKYPTSRTSHSQNISHTEHSTSQTSHIPNIPHLKYSTSRTSHISNIPNIPHPQHPKSSTSHIPNIPPHPQRLHNLSIPYAQYATFLAYHIPYLLRQII